MFGYINANYRELTTEQRQQYQSYYCGLCRELHHHIGPKGQVLLNYDMTFLVILLTGLYEPDNAKEDFICALHPLKKKVSRSNEITEYAAKMNVLLAYHNFEDDWIDDRSLYKRGLMKLFEKDYKAICADYPRQARAVANAMKKLTVAEIGKESNLDAVSGITGEMLAEIFVWKEDEWAEELRALGFYLGKFIYLMDAYQDMKVDEKMCHYNPLICHQKEHPSSVDVETYTRLVLNSMMAECAKSFERMPIVKNADLIRNILYSGVWTKYESLQLKKDTKKDIKDKGKNTNKNERSV